MHGQRGSAIEFDADSKVVREFRGDGGNNHHQQNFVDAVRSGDSSLLCAPAHIGNDSTGWCNLINIATRAPNLGGANKLAGLPQKFGTTRTEAILHQLGEIVTASDSSVTGDALPLGPMLSFDSESRQFVGTHAEQANALLRRSDRSAFTVPEVTVT